MDGGRGSGGGGGGGGAAAAAAAPARPGVAVESRHGDGREEDVGRGGVPFLAEERRAGGPGRGRRRGNGEADLAAAEAAVGRPEVIVVVVVVVIEVVIVLVEPCAARLVDGAQVRGALGLAHRGHGGAV